MALRKRKQNKTQLAPGTAGEEYSYNWLDYDFLFSSDMKLMYVVSKEAGETTGKYLLSDGVSIRYENDQIVVNGDLPAGEDIVPLSNYIALDSGHSFTGITLRNYVSGVPGNEEKHIVIAAAGIGVVDFMDTDPIRLMFLSYELGATATLPVEMNNTTVQAEIRSILIDSGTTTGTLDYSATNGTGESEPINALPTIRITTYYQVLPGA